jgi:tight adherence protein C
MTLILLFVFLTVGLLTLALLAMTEKAPALSRLLRLHDLSPIEIAHDPQQLSERRLMQERLAALAAQFAGRAGRNGAGTYAGVRQRLIQAGFRHGSALAVYMGSRVALTLACGIAFLLTPAAWSLGDFQFLAALAGAAGLGFTLPGIVVDSSRRRRQKQIQRALPDVVDLMVVCLEAGLSLSSALLRVATEFDESSPVLAAEFKLVVLETQAGKSSAQALRGLADRTGVPNVASFVSMLIQTERFGTNLVDTFRIHSESMRQQRLLAAEEVAQKAPVKMLVPAAVFIFPATLIVTLGPGIIQIMSAFN